MTGLIYVSTGGWVYVSAIDMVKYYWIIHLFPFLQGLVFHSDRGSQYTSKRFRFLLKNYGLRASMGDVGACWDNAVVERFFGSLKHDWILKVYQPTREHMKQDVTTYIKYYNLDRLHTANRDLSPVNFENFLKKVSSFS